MASAVKDVGVALLSKAAEQLYNNMMRQRYREATGFVDELLGAIKAAQEQLKHDLTKEMAGRELVKINDQIEGFAQKYRYTLEDKAKDPNHPDLEILRRELNDSSTGVAAQLMSMDTILLGKTELTTSLLKVLLNEWGNVLCDESSSNDKTIYWYLRKVDAFMGAVVYRQMAGLALWVFAANAGEKRAKEFSDIVSGRIQGQIDFIWNNWLPLLRITKKDYLTPIDPDTWFCFEWWADVLCQDAHHRIKKGKDEYSGEQSWKFTPPLDVSGERHSLQDGIVYLKNKGGANAPEGFVTSFYAGDAFCAPADPDGAKSYKLRVLPKPNDPLFKLVVVNKYDGSFYFTQFFRLWSRG